MRNRELLDLAAMAAGLNIIHMPLSGPSIIEGPRMGETWNPLADDGDALRLAAKLRISVAFWKEDVSALLPPINKEFPETYGACLYAATRRAIVRAAAEIGAQSHPTQPTDGGA